MVTIADTLIGAAGVQVATLRGFIYTVLIEISSGFRITQLDRVTLS